MMRWMQTTRINTRGPHSMDSSSKSALLSFLLFTVLALLFGSAVKTAPTVRKYWNRPHSAPILVFDNVLNDETCSRLHQAAASHDDDECVFRWPQQQVHNHIEQVITSILNEMYSQENESFIVEYWTRQEWQHTWSHADLDEDLCEELDTLRHPIKGHVLYLTKGAMADGPTVVFPNITRGGEMYFKQEQEMLVVPFHKGRLLQFQGDLLHAVPRPTDLWIHPSTTYDEDDDELDHSQQFHRSVILFNLWTYLPMGYTKDNEATEDMIADTDTTVCNPKSAWQQASIIDDWKGSLWDTLVKKKSDFQLPLMGGEVRRGTKEVALQLQATDLVEQALLSSLSDVRPKRAFLSIPIQKQQQKESMDL